MAPNSTNSSTIDNNSRLINKDIYRHHPADFMQQLDDQAAQLLDLQQGVFKATFESWKQLSQLQINSAIDYFGFLIDQSLSARERLGLIAEQQFGRLQEITIYEHSLTLDAVEIFHAQSGAMREQIADIWQQPPNLYEE